MQTLEQEVNKPTHYNSHESGVEAISITRYLPGDLSNVWKYAMRYEDKGTPKKDLLKLGFYFNDYRTYFIDENNAAVPFTVPADTIARMFMVMYAEPNETIRQLFKEVIGIVVSQGVVNPARLDASLAAVKTLAESFSK